MRKRSRITITLEPDLLKRVDDLVDGLKIKSRSQAIETLIVESLGASVDTAVIMAGGTRLEEISSVLKKINGKFLLTIMIEQFKKYKITRLIICSGSNISKIKDVYGDGSRFGVNIAYVEEKKPLGTMGALKLAEDKIDRNNFLVLYGDIITDMNLGRFIEFHFAEQRPVTVGVKPRMGEKIYGQVFMQGNAIVDYSDKKSNVGLSLVNTGVYLFSKEVFAYIKPNVPQHMGEDLFPELIKRELASGYIFQGIWFDISLPENYDEAQRRWRH